MFLCVGDLDEGLARDSRSVEATLLPLHLARGLNFTQGILLVPGTGALDGRSVGFSFPFEKHVPPVSLSTFSGMASPGAFVPTLSLGFLSSDLLFSVCAKASQTASSGRLGPGCHAGVRPLPSRWLGWHTSAGTVTGSWVSPTKPLQFDLQRRPWAEGHACLLTGEGTYPHVKEPWRPTQLEPCVPTLSPLLLESEGGGYAIACSGWRKSDPTALPPISTTRCHVAEASGKRA